MKRSILYIFIALTLPGCRGSEGRFRLKGDFTHLRQGEFYIYSNDGVSADVDTIKVELGEFDYETDLQAEATYQLLYPNLSELPVFAAPGEVVHIKGDARNLKMVEVSGNKDNELYTEFRLATAEMGGETLRKEALKFIAAHPQQRASVQVFRQYLLTATAAPADQIERAYRSLCEAQPHNPHLLSLRTLVDARDKQAQKGGPLPDFSLTLPDSTTLQRADYKGRNLLVVFWASWMNECTAQLFRLQRLWKKNPGRFEVVSISLDVDKSAMRSTMRLDSITWPNYCDFRGMDGEATRQFLVPAIPYYILTGTDGKIVALGSAYDKEIEPALKKIIAAQD